MGEAAGGYGVYGKTTTGKAAVQALNQGDGHGVFGLVGGAGSGVFGAAEGSGPGVYGTDYGTGTGIGVSGSLSNTANTSAAVQGSTAGTGAGVMGEAAGGYGVYGKTTTGKAAVQALNQGDGHGVFGLVGGAGSGVFGAAEGSGPGVYGTDYGTGTGIGVSGSLSNTANTSAAVQGSTAGTGPGVSGVDASKAGGKGVSGSSSYGVGVYAASTHGTALYVDGTATVTGALSKPGGSFRIDHPLDPQGKYLYHSFVESPDMMNVYNGTVTLDGEGRARVSLPDWFEALNRDYRYQLTAIGAPAPNLHVQQEVDGSRFSIAGGTPGLKVSWQVTGIRQDAWANANRIPVEVDKPAHERGRLVHPELLADKAPSDIRHSGRPARDGTDART